MAKLTKSDLTAGILKAIGIFGGVEMIKIICSIVRSKFIAIWIGSVGVGLFGIYNTTIDLLSIFFQLGIRDSAVRDIAKSNKSEIPRIAVIVRRWALILGIFGLISTIALSPALSLFTFDDNSHTVAFLAIALIIFMSSIQSGELAILQGTQRINLLAKASMYGVLIGVAISIPMFYIWGINSVIPALLVYSVSTTIAILSQRVKIQKPTPPISFKETINKGQGFITLGIYLTISAIVTNLSSFIFMSYLNKEGDIYTVGYYNAGYVMINKYVGVIFIAIAMEYYPRLANVITSNKRISTFVSHEMSIALWVLLPIIATFIAINEFIIPLLYSKEFLSATPFIIWATIGTIFRAISWCMAFVILARGDGKTYLLTESLSGITYVTLNIFAYHNYGIEGLGIAYMTWYIIYTIIVAIIYHYRYNLCLNKNTYRLIFISIAISLTSTLSYKFIGWQIPALIALVTIPFSIKYILHKKRNTTQRVNSCH